MSPKFLVALLLSLAALATMTTARPQVSGSNVGGDDDGASPSVGGRKREFLYFAYGSNLWTERIRINNPNVVFKATGLLENYKLDFPHFSTRWQGAVASISPASNSKVYGVLWKLNDLRALDKQEGVALGIYERFKVKVKSEGKTVDAWTYRVTEGAKQKALTTYGVNLKPSVAYKDAIISGAEEHNLPASYVRDLKKIPTRAYGEY